VYIGRCRYHCSVVFSSDKTGSVFLFLATTNLIMDCYQYLQLVDNLRVFYKRNLIYLSKTAHVQRRLTVHVETSFPIVSLVHFPTLDVTER
jgi:hypothetical protein